MEKRTFTANLNLPAGTQAGTYEEKVVLDRMYDRATGFATYVNVDGGVPNFKFGLSDESSVYAAPTNNNYFAASTDCPKRDRLTPVTIVCDGTNLTMRVVLASTLSTALDLDVVFELERTGRAR